MGIAGEIRTRMIKFRSKQETSEDYLPRIESARDNLGNIYTFGKSRGIFTKMTIHPGDVLDFIVTASDPLGETLHYNISIDGSDMEGWKDGNTFSAVFTKANIGADVRVRLYIQSNRDYHAEKFWDDIVEFYYTVLPSK